MGIKVEKQSFPRANAFLDRMANRLVTSEQYLFEVTLTACSVWGAWVLFHPPSNFLVYPGSYKLLIAINPNEDFWAVLLTLGACLKFFGLHFCLLYRAHGLGLTCRILGLGISGFFWPIFGLSAYLNNPDTMAGVPIGIVGITAWWTLLRFPWTPARSI